MAKYIGILVSFAVFLEYTIVKVDPKVIVKLMNLECFPNPDWVNMTCKLRAVNWRKTLANINAELMQDLNRVTVHAQVYKRYNNYQPFPIKVEFEFCPILAGNSKNYYFAPLVHELVNKSSNLNHTCPYHKGEKLFAKDLDFQPFDFINLNFGAVGAGRYRLDVSVYGNGAKTRALLVIGYCDIKEE